MTFETLLCRNTDAVRRVLIRSSRFASFLGAAVSITAIDRVNARSREGARADALGEENDWSGRVAGLSGGYEIAMLKRAFAEAAGARRCQFTSELEAIGV